MRACLGLLTISISLLSLACESEQHLGTACADDAGADSGLSACEVDEDSGPPLPTGLTRADRVDLLFVVDNSGSMREEQALLQRELPKLMHTFATGMRGDKRVAAPVTDLHVGVVSVDMGIQLVADIKGCTFFGEDGVLRRMASDEQDGTCATQTGERFLNFVPGQDDPVGLVRDFACTAALGTDGCGFEQQLEAPLKALTAADSDIEFADGGQGHGDGENAGFLRNDPQHPSLIVVVVVTDEEDCSTTDGRIFTTQRDLEPSDPLYEQDLNLRCHYNQDKLHDVSRYVEGLRALRPGNEDLVVFAAIAGVPEELVDASARAAVDLSDATAAGAYYDAILTDSRMIETIDPERAVGQGNLLPVCTHVDDAGNGRLAYPAPRIVKTAQGFGKNGLIQSICADDFGPAVEALLDLIEPHLAL